jgi:hypothetical protein
VADHLSRLTVDYTENASPISETFPDEQLMHVAQNPAPWFANIVNDLITRQIPCIGGDKISLDFCPW